MALLLAVSIAGGAVALASSDDRARATSLVAQLEKDAAHRALTARAVASARTELERAERLRQVGDGERARVAESTALSWAELGSDLVRTAEAERLATDARRAAGDAGAQAERERALLDEAIAQNGRLRAQIEEAEREGREGATRTARLPSDGGVTKPAKKPAATSAARADGGKP